MNPSTQIQKASERLMEYTPFGAADKIKLSVEIIKNIVAVPTRSGKTCGDRDALKFMMLCQAQRLNPFAGDAYLVGYDNKAGGATFSLITAHVAFLKRAESSPDFEGLESGIILETEGTVTEREGDFHLPSEKVVGGWARVHRKGRKPTYRRLSVEQRKPAYPTSFWEGDKAAEQIVKCAEADALRATFPTLLGGLHVQGEIVPIEPNKTAIDLPASRLVSVKAGEPEAAAEQQAAAAAPQGQKSKQDELAEIVTGAGYTFDEWRAWAAREGQLADGSVVASFDQVPDAVAKRLVLAKVGMLRAIALQVEAA